MSQKLTDDAKLQDFKSLLREEAIGFYQSPTVTKETTLNDVLTKFHEKLTQTDLKEIARYKKDQTKKDPTAETFSNVLKRFKVNAKQALQDNAGQQIQTFLFGNLPKTIQQELINCNKKVASPKSIRGFSAQTPAVQSVHPNDNAAIIPLGHYDGK